MRIHKCMYMYIVYMTLNDSGDRKCAFQSFTRLADCMLTHACTYVCTYVHACLRTCTFVSSKASIVDIKDTKATTTHMG